MIIECISCANSEKADWFGNKANHAAESRRCITAIRGRAHLGTAPERGCLEDRPQQVTYAKRVETLELLDFRMSLRLVP